MIKLKNGPWKLTELAKIEKQPFTVFSCFHCGGGSSMGYKLSGLNVLGGVEVDPKMMEIYRTNFKPVHSYLMPIQDFKKIKELPAELNNLDILDGSPPCSNFSMMGKRDKNWGQTKEYAEGKVAQQLENLFFDFIDVAKKLQPKVIVAENVKGLITGTAKGFVKEIKENFQKAGYEIQLFLLNSKNMGVPQERERVFFIGSRKDLKLPKLTLSFNEKQISAKEAIKDLPEDTEETISEAAFSYWTRCGLGDKFSKFNRKGSRFNQIKLSPYKPAPTVATNKGNYFHWSVPRYMNDSELIRFQTFPDDFNFCNQSVAYVLGMSVPPFMIQRINKNIIEKWLINT